MIRVILGTPPLPPPPTPPLHPAARHPDPQQPNTNNQEAAAMIARIGVTYTAIMGIGMAVWSCARWEMIAG